VLHMHCFPIKGGHRAEPGLFHPTQTPHPTPRARNASLQNVIGQSGREASVMVMPSPRLCMAVLWMSAAASATFRAVMSC
jgi:hypothetical protein